MMRAHSERGAQLVEFAMTLPLLLLVLGGIAEFGLLFHAAEVTNNAAREAARVVILPAAGANAASLAQARVTEYLSTAGLRGATTAVTTVAPATITLAGGTTTNGVRVTVTYSYDCLFLGPIVRLMNGNFADTITFNSTTLMRTQAAAAAP